MGYKKVLAVVLLALYVGYGVCSPQDGRTGTRFQAASQLQKAASGAPLAPQQPLPRALKTMSSRTSHSTAAGMLGRKLQQFAGMANFAVGMGIEAAQRGVNTAGALSQLANFYGIEGLGMRHRMGALPAPGGLELMALAGPAAMPGPTGFTVGWLGGTVEALAASANPLTALAAGQAVQDLVGSQGAGQLIGATGFSGLGMNTGLAAAALGSQPGGLLNAAGGLGGLAGGLGGGLGGGAEGLVGNLGSAALAGMTGMTGGLSSAAGLGSGLGGGLGASGTGIGGKNLGAAKGAAAGAALTGASQLAGKLIGKDGAVKGAAISGAGKMAGQAVSAIGQGADTAANVAKEVKGAAASSAGGLLNMAGKFLGKLSDLTGPGHKSQGGDASNIVATADDDYDVITSSSNGMNGAAWDSNTYVSSTDGSMDNGSMGSVVYSQNSPSMMYQSSNVMGSTGQAGMMGNSALAGMGGVSTTSGTGMGAYTSTYPVPSGQMQGMNSMQSLEAAKVGQGQQQTAGSTEVLVSGPFPDAAAAFAASGKGKSAGGSNN